MKRILLVAIALLVPTFAIAQDKPVQPTPDTPETLEQIAKETPISVFIPDPKIADKLTPEEQEAIKLHCSKFISIVMANSYKQGAEDSSAYLMKHFADLTAQAQAQLASQQSQQPQFSRIQRVAAVLQGISNGMAQASQNRLNCVTNHLGSYSYTKCY